MKISLIGMSNTGKTYWSKKLEHSGFLRFGCDDIISQKLKITDVASWMGQRDDDRYPKNSQLYLSFEHESVKEIINKIKQFKKDTKVVVDTTGSLIYLNERLINQLKKYTKFVNLDVPSNGIRIMYKQYIRHPKPVYWGPPGNIVKSYADLLQYRLALYKEYADITFAYDLLRNRNFSVADFIRHCD